MGKYEIMDRVIYAGRVRYIVGRRCPNLQKREKCFYYDLSDKLGDPRPAYREVPERLIKPAPQEGLSLAVNNAISRQNRLAGESVL